MTTKTHEIKLDGYGAHTTLAEDRPIMLLGTAESYGIETLHVVSGKSWEGLTITATFNAPDGTSTDMLMDTDGNITVPSEATLKSGSGKIVFTGVSDGVQRISCDLEYFVVAHSAINGVQSGGTAPRWFEQAVTRFMPAGGTAGQVLTKLTDTDFDAKWQDSQGGADGKSAYSYAVDGGYTGTEAEFAAKLAAESIDKALFVVNITQSSDGTFSADKTFEEITQAYNEGKYSIVANFAVNAMNTFIVPFVTITGAGAAFGGVVDLTYFALLITPNNEVQMQMLPLATETSKLPNPYPLTFTGAVNETYDGSSAKTIEIPSGGGSTVNNNTVNQYFYNSMATGKYELKSGYGTKADIYITADGTETAISGLAYEVTDYIPVSANTTYVAYCNGYALYDREKTFVSAVIDKSNYGAIKEFTPEQDGYVRITYRPYSGGTTENFNRFCEKSEIKKAPRDYMPAPSPFFDIRIPCNVDLYGDSNSYGYGLSDTANAWANRLGALLLSMPEEVTNRARCEMSVFAGIYSGYPKLGNNGVVYMSAYTDKFTVNGLYITAVDVYIDGVQQDQMTASPAEYTCPLGYHEIELRGSSGVNNVITSIVTNKTRSFTNHAVTGYNSEKLPNTVDGNVEIVMYGTNDRTIAYGRTANNMARFYSVCEAAGAKVYFLSPIPTTAEGEIDASYVQTIGDVISQIPDINYIDVYKDMQLYSMLSTETLYSDKLHLNDLGHKVLFCIVASKLHLAALNSIFNV